MQNMFYDIGLMIIVATTFAYFAKLIKQPLIPAYVLTGIILGPVLGVITNMGTIRMLSEIGITFLLFIVGLEINFKKLKNIGLVATLGGTIQIMVLFSLGFIIASVLGFLPMEALYVGIILSFSSTMVVIKLLSDKRELDTLHGRLIVGFLLTEDFFAILALSILPILNDFSILLLASSLLKGVSIVIAAWLASKYVFPKMFKFAAKSQELLFLMSIAVCFIFATLFSYIGLSIIIGAFIAGVTLANLPYNVQIISKVSSLKDFFATIFFVSLGLELILTSS
jgi:Kef-type K+ transport system membrane component KefB